MQSETWIGLAASICTGIAMLPQLIKTFKEKKPGDISYMMLAVLMVGLAIWVWYGFVKEDWIIIISNAFSLLINLLIVSLNVFYKQQKKR
jgi:MtN3 and saliva related transmembrane protein